jgi:hydrogenase/urease accessory protein HupE
MKLGLMALAGLLLAPVAMAHPRRENASSFAAGWWHPFSGLDHVLAMLGVAARRFSVPAASRFAGAAIAACGALLLRQLI